MLCSNQNILCLNMLIRPDLLHSDISESKKSATYPVIEPPHTRMRSKHHVTTIRYPSSSQRWIVRPRGQAYDYPQFRFEPP